MNHEFQEVSLGLYDQRELKRLGEEGWDLANVTSEAQGFSARLSFRGATGSSAPPWEYAIFTAESMPHPDWRNHLESCGWTGYPISLSVGRPYPSARFYITKRSAEWRGTDAGDLVARLEALGYQLAPHSREARVREFLQFKWVESEKAGRNLGTRAAARLWVARQVLPEILARNGASRITRPDEELLDELLALHRATGVIGPAALERTVERWVAMTSA
jgi:hypothetical protein